MGKVFVVTSGKGGTGKTMFSVNFAGTLAKKGYKTLVLDFDLGLRNLDLYMGLENHVVYDVYDVLTGLCQIKQALIKDKRFKSLYLMGASPVRNDGKITPLHMKVLCDKLRESFDYIVIDAPSGRDDGMVMATAGADAAIVITTPDFSAIRDADNVDRQLLELGIEERYLIVNKAVAEMMEKGYAPKLSEITSMIKSELVGVIQMDENINISTNLGIPIIMKNGTYIDENFKKITERILNS